MKILVIALMIFFLNLSVAMVDLLGIYNFNVARDDLWTDDVSTIRTGQYNPDIAADVQTSFGFGDFVSGFNDLVKAIFRSVNVAATIQLFDTNDEWGAIPGLFATAVTIIYLLGVAQFISNRSTKGMQ